uniref:Uncharacterized protein n=1 Tax=Oryza sativa subsp. japonica TaxID=39947 RepID=Q75I09_ORYSJ|nr:hypothetical protein [Oryza sativa Japonica Group]
MDIGISVPSRPCHCPLVFMVKLVTGNGDEELRTRHGTEARRPPITRSSGRGPYLGGVALGRKATPARDFSGNSPAAPAARGGR